MIKLWGTIHDIRAVAVSGGRDSMAILHFLRNTPKNQHLSAIYFNHGTEHGAVAEKFVTDFCESNKIPLIIGKTQRPKSADESWEEYWRNERLGYFKSLRYKIATAHHLGDCAETYLWNSINGRADLISYQHANIVRPFLLTPRFELESWNTRHGVTWIEDPSNSDVSHPRNRIRHVLLPEILKMNPGFLTVVRKLQEKKLHAETQT